MSRVDALHVVPIGDLVEHASEVDRRWDLLLLRFRSEQAGDS
ncbi:hypothetical protein ACIPY6_28695 [Streptomyces sp. NPDC090054]